jgi:hypothetical protein
MINNDDESLLFCNTYDLSIASESFGLAEHGLGTSSSECLVASLRWFVLASSATEFWRLKQMRWVSTRVTGHGIYSFSWTLYLARLPPTTTSRYMSQAKIIASLRPLCCCTVVLRSDRIQALYFARFCSEIGEKCILIGLL